LTVTGGGAERSWQGWRRDGTPDGVEVGHFDIAGGDGGGRRRRLLAGHSGRRDHGFG
jgi:hypothetical protein